MEPAAASVYSWCCVECVEKLIFSCIMQLRQLYRQETTMSLYKNIAKKRARIKAGSGEKMRKKGQKGAPTDKAFKQAAKTAKKKPKKKAKK